MLFSCLVLQMPTTSLLIHRLSVITSIRSTVNLPVSITACCRRSWSHTHCPRLRSGKNTCFPIVRGHLLFGRKSSLGEPNCYGTWEGGQFLPAEQVPERWSEVFRAIEQHHLVNSCSSVRYWAGVALLLSESLDWGKGHALIIFLWLYCGGQ